MELAEPARKPQAWHCEGRRTRGMGPAKENAMRLLLSLIGVFGLVTLSAPSAFAKKGGSQVEAEPPAPAGETNACGCYRDAQEKCHCTKVPKSKLKCVCEGECEPPECVAKRRHDEEKAAEEALRKIKERDKKAQADSKKDLAKKEKEMAAEQAKKEKEKKAEEAKDPRWKAATQ
jgi:hypothetical protein